MKVWSTFTRRLFPIINITTITKKLFSFPRLTPSRKNLIQKKHLAYFTEVSLAKKRTFYDRLEGMG